MYKEIIEKHKNILNNNYDELIFCLDIISNKKKINEDRLNDFINELFSKPSVLYYFYSIENYFIKLSNKIINKNIEYEKNSTLHIMTEAYLSGGHTRVVERWIESSDKTEKHCIIFTSSNTEVMPEALIQNVKNRNGEIIEVDSNLDILQKAQNLADYASKFEHIILHIHPFDYIPIIAFGSNSFKRPIYFYNHADHLPWFGLSIIDCLLEIRTYGKKITKLKRNYDNSIVLGIPTVINKNNPYIENNNMDKSYLKNKKVILSYGNSYKFNNFYHLSLLDYIKMFDENYVFILIGLNEENNSNFYNYSSSNPNKLIIKNTVPFDELRQYLNLADIIIDSFPVCGGTALLDAINLNKPVLSLSSIVGNFDYIENSYAYCKSIEELYSKTIEILHNENMKNNLITELKRNIEIYTPNNFQNKINEIYKNGPQEHHVKVLKKEYDNKFVLNDFFSFFLLPYNKHKIRVKFDFKFIKLVSYKHYLKKYYILYIFNKPYRLTKLKI